MKYCANCGTEVNEAGLCPKCDSKPARQTPLVRTTESSWIEKLFRSYMVFFSFAGAVYFLSWPVTLLTASETLSPALNIYFMALALGVIGSMTLAFLVRGKILLLASLFLAGWNLWVMPDLITFFFYELGAGSTFDFFLSGVGSFNTIQFLFGSSPELFVTGTLGWIGALGFHALSFAHLPMVLVGVVVIGQQAISENLQNRKKPSQPVLTDSPLVVGAFIGAFLVPLAGLVLALITLPRWSAYEQRDRGLVVAALAISILSVIFSLFLGLFFFTTLTPIFETLF